MREYQPARSVIATLAILAAQSAFGESTDILAFNAKIGWTYDSNLFKRPPDASLGPTDSDEITTTRLGVVAKIPVSLQSFDLTAGIAANHYARFSENDSTHSNYNATWRWQLFKELSGTISADRQQAQTEFSDFRGAIQNQRTTDTQRFGANLSLTEQSTIGTAITEKKERNSQDFVQQESNRQTIGEVSIRHSLPAGASVALAHSRSHGENLDGREFSVRNTDLRVNWPLSGKTLLASSLGRVARKNPGAEDRDFSGNNGAVSLTWLATAKTSLTASRTRSTDSWLEAGSSFTVRESSSVAGNWMASAAVTVRIALIRDTQSFEGASATLPPSSRRDTTDKQSITLEWAPWQNATVVGSVQNARRTSNDSIFNYKSLQASLNANVLF